MQSLLHLALVCAGCSLLPPEVLLPTPLHGQQAAPAQRLALAAKRTDLLDHPEKWPFHLDSSRYPVSIRYLQKNDQAQARRVLGYLEHSWQVEIEQLGFPAPLPSDRSGQERLQVYLMRGADTAVEATRRAQTPGLWWDAWESYLSIDAWGKYGGERSWIPPLPMNSTTPCTPPWTGTKALASLRPRPPISRTRSIPRTMTTSSR